MTVVLHFLTQTCSVVDTFKCYLKAQTVVIRSNACVLTLHINNEGLWLISESMLLTAKSYAQKLL